MCLLQLSNPLTRESTMKIKESIQQDVAVLSLSGNLMGGPETQALHEKVKSLIADGINNVVVDLKKVKWLNSSGLGVLMACWGSLKNVGGDMKLANATDKVQSIFMITKLVEFFETFDSVDRAVASFHAR